MGDAGALQASLRDNSYLFFRGLIDAATTLTVRGRITDQLHALGWLAPGTDPMEARRGPGATGEGPSPSPAFFEAYARVQALQVFHELAHHQALVAVAADVLEEEVLVHPRKIFRVSPADDPKFVTPPHQDFRLIQGTVDVLTAWMPLGDCPDALGGLKVLAGSHVEGLRPCRTVVATGGVACDAADDDPRWRSTDFQAGDVLFFHSLTVHGAKPNRTDHLRLSADFRYQARSQPVVEASLLPHYFPEIPPYSELTRGWSSTSSVDVPPGLDLASARDPSGSDLTVEPSPLTASRG